MLTHFLFLRRHRRRRRHGNGLEKRLEQVTAAAAFRLSLAAVQQVLSTAGTARVELGGPLLETGSVKGVLALFPVRHQMPFVVALEANGARRRHVAGLLLLQQHPIW